MPVFFVVYYSEASGLSGVAVWWTAEQRGDGSSAVPAPLPTQSELQLPLPP